MAHEKAALAGAATKRKQHMDSSTEYPKRQSHFAHKAIRLLGKTCAAQEIGPEACWLVTVIAHTEDAKRYRGPVTFYNEQLMPIAGFGGRARLVRARQKAMEAGWLHYEEGGKRRPGRYWILIPPNVADLPDGPIDESTEGSSCSDSEQQTEGDDTSRSKTERQPDANRNGNRTANAPLSSLSPDPSPNPEKRVSARADSPPDREAEFIELWNKTPGGCRIRGDKLSGNRKSHFQTRLRDPGWFPSFLEALDKFPLKCTVGVEDPWRPDADFILRPDSVTKIVEGKYDWTKNNGNAKPSRTELPTGAGHKHGVGRVDTSGF